MTLNKHEKDKILRKLQSGDLNALKEIILNHKSLNFNELVYEKTGDSAIHITARLGSPSDLQFLLETFSFTYINCRNKDDKTPLHEAVQFSRLDNVNYLLQNGAEVNALKRSDWTPLMLACTKTNPDTLLIADTLIQHGALINHKNKDGWSALHFACKEGNIDTVNLLLVNGAVSEQKTNNGRTPLHIASLHGHHKVVCELLKHTTNVNVKDCCGNTPFLDAVLGGNVETCKVLLQNGADVYVTNSSGFGAVHLAASTNKNATQTLEFLVKQLNCDVNSASKIGLTALHCAARANNKENYDLLISLGANPLLKDQFQRTSAEYFTIQV